MHPTNFGSSPRRDLVDPACPLAVVFLFTRLIRCKDYKGFVCNSYISLTSPFPLVWSIATRPLALVNFDRFDPALLWSCCDVRLRTDHSTPPNYLSALASFHPLCPLICIRIRIRIPTST